MSLGPSFGVFDFICLISVRVLLLDTISVRDLFACMVKEEEFGNEALGVGNGKLVCRDLVEKSKITLFFDTE